MWIDDLRNMCNNFRIEPFITDNKKIIFFCPKIPETEIKNKLIKILPKTKKYEFIEGPKISTTQAIKAIFSQAGIIKAEVEQTKHKLIIKAETFPNFGDNLNPLWGAINRVLEQDGFFTSWKITINDKTANIDLKVAQEIKKHPKWDKITDDDLINLKILLNQNKDVNDFIGKV